MLPKMIDKFCRLSQVKKAVQEAFKGKQTPKGFVDNMSRTITIALILIIAASSVPWIQVTSAQPIPTPSVPQFTVKVVAHPYDVEPIYSTDEYTGEQVVVQEGYHVENKSIEVQIKNQPFSYVSSNGTVHHLYYNIRVKGHYGDNWVEHYRNYKAMTYAISDTMIHEDGMFVGGALQSDSQYTTLTISASEYRSDAELDIQVMATVGHDSHKIVNDNWHVMLLQIWPRSVPAILLDTTSAWSSTQTISLSEGTTITSPSVSQQPTSTSTAPPTPTTTSTQPDTQTNILPQLSWEQTAILVLVGVVGALSVGIAMLWRKVTHISKANRQSEPPPPT